MKSFVSLLFLLFFTQIIFAEETSEFEGKISTKGGQVLSYKIVYKIKPNNTIEGYSLTDIEGENLTKTWIKGTYNPVLKTLSFKETGNAFTKTGDDESTFCFVNAENLKIKKINGKILINGDFKGIYPSGKVGAVGTIFLLESSTIKQIKLAAKSIKSKPNVNKAKKETKATIKSAEKTNSIEQVVKTLSEEQKLVLMANEKLLIEASKKDLCLVLWDGAFSDGDSISIYLNDKILQENILLTKTRKTLNLSTPANSFKLKIIALNIGTKGANTVSFEVKDNYNIKSFSSKLNKGEYFEMEFHTK